MTGEAENKRSKKQGQTEGLRAPGEGKPVLFLSHKHTSRDKNIADALATFFGDWGEDKIEIVQTSSEGRGLPIGKHLNQSLLRALWATEVFVLVYTEPDEDWAYCMWEAGAAIDPDKPGKTRVVVITCCGQKPDVFKDIIVVDARKEAEILNLTSQFLTTKDFFPSRSKPISGHTSNSEHIKNRARSLYEELKPKLPPVEVDPPSSWPTWPWMSLELSEEARSRLQEQTQESGESPEALELARAECLIHSADEYAARLFNKRTLEGFSSLAELMEDWRRNLPDQRDTWIDCLSRQIVKVANDAYLDPDWQLLCDFEEERWYVPVIFRVYEVPAEQCQRCDLYFLRVDLDDSQEVAMIPRMQKT